MLLGMQNPNLKRNRRFNKFFFYNRAIIIFLKLNFQNVLTVLAYTDGKMHKTLHTEDLGDVKCKSKEETENLTNISFSKWAKIV